MYIYLIVNHVTGKYYVGQHKGSDLLHYLQQKFYEAEHRLKARSHLYASMRKHGREAFTIHALLSDIQTRPELDAHERDFIAFLKSQDPEYGYNICRGGEGFTGPFTAEHRAKLSKGIKASWTPERRAAQSAKRKGVPRPPQVGEAVRRMRTGVKASAETKHKIRAARLSQPDPRLGTHHSEATKKRMSDAKKGMPSSFRGKHHTDETKEKCRQGGLIGGRKAVESGQLASISGLGGRKAVESGQVQALGRVQGQKNVESGLLARLRTSKHQKFAIHARWHTNRGINNPACELCSDAKKVTSPTL